MATAATIDVMLRANTATYRAAMLEANQYTQRQLGQVRKEAASTASSLQAMNRAAAGFIGFQAFRSGVGALLEVTKQNQALINSMRASVGSSALAADSLSFVSQTAKELGLDFQSAAEGFQRLTASATANGVAMRDQQELFTELSRAATSMQIAPAVVDRAMTALSQSFSKGRFQAEELRQQLAEAIPGVVPRFQRAVMEMVKGTELADKSFDQLLQGGLLDVQLFLPAMTQAFAEMGTTWRDGAGSLQAEMNRLGNAWRELKIDTSSGVFSDVAITSVRLMAENLDRVAGAAALAAGVLAGRMVGLGAGRAYGMAAAPIRGRLAEGEQVRETAKLAQERAKEAAAQVNQTRASMLQTAAWRAQTAQGVEVARQQMAVAFASNEAAQATLAHQQGTLALSANMRAKRDATIAAEVAQRRLAMAQANLTAAQASGNIAAQRDVALKGQLIAAQQAATVATNNLAAARAREAAASRAASVAGMAGTAARSIGSGALALAGGPWGAAAIAVGALGYAYVSMQRKAEEARKEFAAQVDSLNLLNVSLEDTANQYNRIGSGIGVRELAASWNQAGVEIRKADAEVARLQSRIEGLRSSIDLAESGFAGEGEVFQLSNYYTELAKAQEQLRKLSAETEPVRAQFLRLESDIRKSVSPELFEQMREAAIKADNVSFENLRAQLPALARAALDAGVAIDTMLGKLREGALARYSRAALGEVGAMREQFEQSLLAEQAYTNLSREQVAQRRQEFNTTISYVEAAQRLEEQKKSETKAVREGIAATSQQENQYQSAIDRINRQIALDRESLLLTDDMTAAQRLQVIITNEMASAKSKLTAGRENEIRAKLADAVAGGELVRIMDAEKKAAEDMLQLQRQLAEAARTRQMANDADLFAMTAGPEAVERMRRMVDLQAEYQRQVEQLNDKIASDPSRKAAYEAQIEELKRFHERGLIEEEEYQRRLAELRGDWTVGATSALQRYLEESANIAAQMDEVFTNMAKGLEDSIVNFVKTGKLSFKDLANSIIEDIARIAARQMVAGLITGMGNMFGPRITGFAAGGYTGPGGVLQPAGVVHKGEVVWSQRDVAKAGGVAAVEAMRLGQRGYASGGAVGVSVPVRAHDGMQVVINNNGPNEVTAQKEEGMRPDGSMFERLIINVVAKDVARGGAIAEAGKQAYGWRRQAVARG